ncbi:hypothetical protein FRB96_001612 [Tulasnella sp. 330]|nr:hypothetical protein FRB96_001612 [Tulasnella sp. 330]
MADMKPPTEAAMAQAIKVLMASIATENTKSFSVGTAENPTAKLLLRRKAVETLQRAVTKATTLEISAISHAINTHAAIHSLPTELLIKIWSTVLHSFTRLDQEHRPREYYRSLHTFARVSKSWAKILRSQAQFWTYINGGDSWNAVLAAIVRSGELPLTIVVPNPRTVGDFSSPRDPATGRPSLHWLSAAERVEEFCRHMHRWKTVSICTPVHRTLWGRLQTKGSTAPMLEDLVVGHRSFSSEATGLLFGGSTPNLRRVEVRSSEITEMDSPLFTALQVLKLAKVALKMSAVELLALLRRCPDLSELTLIDSDIADPEEPRLQRVVLKSLRKIRLEKLYLYTCVFILSRIDAPDLESLTIASSAVIMAPSWTSKVREERVTAVSTSHVVSCARNLIQNLKGPHILTILLLPRRVTFQSPNPEEAGFSVSIETTETRHYLRWALKMVEEELPEDVRVSLSFGRGYHCASPELLQLIPEMRATVTTLHFRESLEGVNALLRHLTKPLVPALEGGRTEWLLPRLAALHFTGTRDFSEGLLRLVDRRFVGLQTAPQPTSTEPLPVKLWYILFDNVDVDAETLKRLHAALGKERILWEKRRRR